MYLKEQKFTNRMNNNPIEYNSLNQRQKMNQIIDMDPRGEYQRICPYCNESFTAHHMHQIYCPEKNGTANYCKNRQKRIHDNEQKVEMERALKDMTIVLVPTHALENNLKNEVFAIEDKHAKNFTILESLLGTAESIDVEVDLLLDEGFDFELFDELQTIPNRSRRIANYGVFSIVWSENTKILLTHKTELQWIFHK